MNYGQLVIGPAGCGKSTYCSTIARHLESVERPFRVVNLDPAADQFDYQVDIDIRDVVSLDEVMRELQMGPNGGLVYCMEYLLENMDWLREELETLGNGGDYVLFDCPGQIELYTHLDVMRRLVQALRSWEWNICTVYVMDSQYTADASKFLAGSLAGMAAMVQFETPHISVLTKMDLLGPEDRTDAIERYLTVDTHELLIDLNKNTPTRFAKLNEAVASLLDSYSLMQFFPLDYNKTEDVEAILYHIDMAIQFGEDVEVKDRDFDTHDEDVDDNNDDGNQ